MALLCWIPESVRSLSLSITTYMLTFVYIMYIIKRTGIDKYSFFPGVGIEQWFSIFCGREPFIARRKLQQ